MQYIPTPPRLLPHSLIKKRNLPGDSQQRQAAGVQNLAATTLTEGSGSPAFSYCWHRGRGNLATAVCHSRRVKRRQRACREDEVECGLKNALDEVISQPTVALEQQCLASSPAGRRPCWPLALLNPQAVWRRIRPSLLDGGVPLPPIVRPGPSAECICGGGTGPEWSQPAFSSSQPSGHLQRRPVWELLLPGQWTETEDRPRCSSHLQLL